MSAYSIVDGDLAMFNPVFGKAIVTVRPGTISGSSKTVTIDGKTACIVGDEKSVSVPGCPYVSPPYAIPGVGTLKIQKLAGDQQTDVASYDHTKVIRVGSQFQAVFEVQTPAQTTTTPPTPDPMPKYLGQGVFKTKDLIVEVD